MSFNLLADDQLIVDVRTLPEWEKNRIDNTLLIEWQDLLASSMMDIRKTVKFFCFVEAAIDQVKLKKF